MCIVTSISVVLGSFLISSKASTVFMNKLNPERLQQPLQVIRLAKSAQVAESGSAKTSAYRGEILCDRVFNSSKSSMTVADSSPSKLASELSGAISITINVLAPGQLARRLVLLVPIEKSLVVYPAGSGRSLSQLPWHKFRLPVLVSIFII